MALIFSFFLTDHSPSPGLPALGGMPRMEARGGMATGDRGVARRSKTGGFGAVPLGFATDAPRGSAGSFTDDCLLMTGSMLSLVFCPLI